MSVLKWREGIVETGVKVVVVVVVAVHLLVAGDMTTMTTVETMVEIGRVMIEGIVEIGIETGIETVTEIGTEIAIEAIVIGTEGVEGITAENVVMIETLTEIVIPEIFVETVVI